MFAHESERTRPVVSLLNPDPITRTVAYVLERMFTVAYIQNGGVSYYLNVV